MTADFLRGQDGVADAFGLRAGRLMGSPDRGRAEWVQARRVQALSIAMHVTLVVLIAAPILTGFAGRSSEGAKVKQWVRFNRPAEFQRSPSRERSRCKCTAADRAELGRDAGKRGTLAPFSHLVLRRPPSGRLSIRVVVMTPTLPGRRNSTAESHMANPGNPLAPLVTDSSGPGHGGGIGTHCCGGAGMRRRSRIRAGRTQAAGRAILARGRMGTETLFAWIALSLSFRVTRLKRRFEGSIFIEAVILRDGRPTQIRVVRGLGYGLDENAAAVVRKWRFKPAIGPDGNAAEVRIVIELAFRLY